MARAVPPWLHRVCIRMHGPADPWTKLLLFTINSTLDDAGESYPGQESIAKAASMGVSTVRLKVAAASRAQWIAIYPRHRPGQQWKSYSYRSCVPDWIDLAAIEFKDENGGASDGERLADLHESKYGGIDDEAVRGTLYPQKGKRRAPPAHGGSSPVKAPGEHQSCPEAPPADDTKHRQRTDEAPPADELKHRQPLGEKSSPKFLGLSHQGEGAPKRTASFPESEKREPEGSTTKPQLKPSTLLQKVSQADRTKKLDGGEVMSRVRKLHGADISVNEIKRQLNAYADPGLVAWALNNVCPDAYEAWQRQQLP